MVIAQGQLFWVDFGTPIGSEPGFMRPCVVIQNDLSNSSRINTVLVCILTSNMSVAKARGNVAITAGEGNLKKSSVVNCSQVMTVDKRRLKETIGTLTADRV